MSVKSKPTGIKERRVFLLDDHDFLRSGLKVFIEQEPDFKICGEHDRAESAVERILAAAPDVVILDITLPDGSGLDITKAVRAAGFGGAILVLTMHDDSHYAVRILQAGANGYIMKNLKSALVLKALRAVAEGKLYASEPVRDRLEQLKRRNPPSHDQQGIDCLPDRQVQILQLMGIGLNASEIAKRLGISEPTVHVQRSRMKKTLGMNNLSELAHFAVVNFKPRGDAT